MRAHIAEPFEQIGEYVRLAGVRAGGRARQRGERERREHVQRAHQGVGAGRAEGRGEQEPGERGAEHLRAGQRELVQRDRVAAQLGADQLGRERLAGGPQEGDGDAEHERARGHGPDREPVQREQQRERAEDRAAADATARTRRLGQRSAPAPPSGARKIIATPCAKRTVPTARLR